MDVRTVVGGGLGVWKSVEERKCVQVLFSFSTRAGVLRTEEIT